MEADGDLDPLTRLAIKYGTDKWGLHFYTPIYHRFFHPFRNRPIRLLEIGVGGYSLKFAGGGSLAMWADYFARGEITGIDILDKRLNLGPRVKVFQGSQEDPVFLKKVCDDRGPFDIIVDDGSHIPQQVVTSFNALFPSLVTGGLYAIEDIQTTFWPDFGGSIQNGGETLNLARTVMECLNRAELILVDRSHSLPPFAREIKSFHAFHNLFVIEKGDNSEPSIGDYDLENRHAVNAIRNLEEELEREPTAEGLANLAQVYLSGGNLEKARKAVERAITLSPANAIALTLAYAIARQARDWQATVDYLNRILQIEPDNRTIRRELEQIRAEQEK